MRFFPLGFWPSQLLLYGPRWVLLLPALIVLPLVAWLRTRWSSLALALAAVSLVGSSGFNVPWSDLVVGDPRTPESLRVMTCNVQRGDLRAKDLADLIRSTRPDVVLLQEWSLSDGHGFLGTGGWHIETVGEFLVASRYPIVGFEVLRRPDKNYRIIAVRGSVLWHGRTIPMVAVHLMTPRKGLAAIIRSPVSGLGAFREVAQVQRLESELLRRWVENDSDQVLIAGDFNLPVDHPLYRRDWSGLTNAFTRTGWGLGHTMFTRHIGLRIDHVLCGPNWLPLSCSVGPWVGSAHRPVVADLAWKKPLPQ